MTRKSMNTTDTIEKDVAQLLRWESILPGLHCSGLKIMVEEEIETLRSRLPWMYQPKKGSPSWFGSEFGAGKPKNSR